MKRITSSIIAGTALVAVGLTTTLPAFAGSALDTAVFRAVSNKKETKKVKTYNGHEFNIKPVSVSRLSGGRGYKVKGQLSHHLSFRTDDQYYYTVEIRPDGTIVKFDEKIDRGGLTTMILKLPVGEFVNLKTNGRVPPAVTNTVIEEAGRWLGGRLDGKWEGAARKVVLQIGMQVAETYDITTKLKHPAKVIDGKMVKAKTGSTSKPIRHTGKLIQERSIRILE